MNALTFLITTLFDLYLMVVILRIWLQMARADFYNPFSQFIVKATQPIIAPMRRILPSLGRFDTASFVLALLVVIVKVLLISLIAGGGIDILLFLMFAVVSVIKKAGVLLFWMLIIRAILSWFNQGYNPIVMVMGQLTEPVLAPIRRIIPPIGGLDLSVMLVIIGMNFLNMLLAQYIPYWAVI
ncbi:MULTISPECIES: YggT family protein [Shewanella]|uniref:YGGT family n=2 Tax=Shewanella TaxID=22 RepID=A0A1N6T2H6_9GAMM|nr:MULTISPECIES: YggT family protein [Shewanella]MCL1086533.1 YggT family protein [Shewanella glacialipiscicola]MCU7993999.1 YggT family protein [Shewanella glacialipiscicola]MCU8025317.1 YggT family protein [Shewanella glacialipiscicola]PTA50879.1 YggT family protein [Shewanella morhuae]SIQ47605.1 YggT family protein [Shewanella morhuae]